MPARSARRVDETLDNVGDFRFGQRVRIGPFLGNRNGGGCDRNTAAIRNRQGSAALPGNARRRAAPAMAQLNTERRRPIGLEEIRDPLHAGFLGVVVQRKTERRVARLRRDIGRFRQDQTGARDRELPEMHQMPVSGRPVIRRELGHRRDDNPIVQPEPAQFQRFE